MNSSDASAGAAPLRRDQVECLVEGLGFLEGPVWLADARSLPGRTPGNGGLLVFNDLERGRTHWWAEGRTGLLRERTDGANGSAVDRRGRLLFCEHGGRRVARLEPDGRVTTLADRFAGQRLNSPNDLVVDSRGDVYFTDPPYGVEPQLRELDWQGVYRVAAADGSVELLADDFARPNGIAFAPDGRGLAVADTERGHVRRLLPGGIDGGVLCEVPRPDGLRFDQAGRLYVAALDGVRVFAADGALLQHLALPHRPANLAFGGPDQRTLFVCARPALYAIAASVPGFAARAGTVAP